MIDASRMISAGCKKLGIPYSVMDCQAFVESCLKDAGMKINLPGSNAWFREVMKNGWVGTPEECKKKFGKVPQGAFLFILEFDGGEKKYGYTDDLGNASHIGIYTGMTGKEMVVDSGNPENSKYNYGDGALHSSSSRGCVCTSRFSGKSINGGWNRVGIWNNINYNGGGAGLSVSYDAQVIGGALNIRERPNKNSTRIAQIPNGATVHVLEEEPTGWDLVEYSGITGYVVGEYLMEIKPGSSDDCVTVPKKDLEKIYDLLGDWLGLRG